MLVTNTKVIRLPLECRSRRKYSVAGFIIVDTLWGKKRRLGGAIRLIRETVEARWCREYWNIIWNHIQKFKTTTNDCQGVSMLLLKYGAPKATWWLKKMHDNFPPTHCVQKYLISQIHFYDLYLLTQLYKSIPLHQETLCSLAKLLLSPKLFACSQKC